MSVESIIAELCRAITAHNLVQINYSGDRAIGFRLIEPYMIAYNPKKKLVVSAWFLSGESASNEGKGWREYLIDSIQSVSIQCTGSA